MRRKLADPSTLADRVRTAWWTPVCVEVAEQTWAAGRSSWVVAGD